MIYQSNPDRAPDSEFVPGELALLVPGNAARLLDPRRTPVRVIEVRPETGSFVLELLDFEDKGARWVIPFEGVGAYQFARDSRRATPQGVSSFEEAVCRLDQPLEIAADPAKRSETERALEARTADATEWLRGQGRFRDLAAAVANPAMSGPVELCED